jgi:hypothetical protein
MEGTEMEGSQTEAPALQGGGTPNNTGLPDDLKVGIEKLSGLSMDDVKVHYNSDKPEQLGALAYAQGTDIYIASGQEEHLAHEAWHVVQQKEGRVAKTMQLKGGVGVNDDSGLEREADVMGARALKTNSASIVATDLKTKTAKNTPIQGFGFEDVQLMASYFGLDNGYIQVALTTIGLLALGTILLTAKKENQKPEAIKAKINQELEEDETADEADKEADEETDKEADEETDEEADQETDEEAEVDDDSNKDTSDFQWIRGKATRNKTIPMGPTRLAAWTDFCQNKPVLKKKKGKKKRDPGREMHESKRAASAAAAASIPASPAFEQFKQVVLPDGTAFFVDKMKRAEGTKSSSKAGKKGTKPLAIIYGHYNGANAEVHVHFNTGAGIDTHTGAHVKIGSQYFYDWGAGTASAQAALNEILNTGFSGDAWTRSHTYV